MKKQPRQTNRGLRSAGVAATATAIGGLSLSAVAVAPVGTTTAAPPRLWS